MIGRGIALALAVLALSGCDFGRHSIANPGECQAVCVESGDRLFFDVEEDPKTGRWDFTCDDADVEVIIDHVAGNPGKAEVTIRIRRGYDGPSEVTFFKRQAQSDRAKQQKFTITLYKRTGDSAFWR